MSFKLKSTYVLLALLASPVAYATNASFLPGYGVQSTSMGGVGISSGQDAISAAANPANLAYVGMRGDMDITAFNPRVKAYIRCGAPFNFGCYNDTFESMGWVDSDSDWYFIPDMAMSMPLSEKLSMGVAFVSASGMGSSFTPNFFSFNGNQTPADTTNLGVQLMQMIIPISIAYKPVESQSIGFSLVPAVQRFNASGLDAFKVFNISNDPEHMTNQGNDYSYGAGVRLGWIGNFMDDKVSVGATYASRIYMTKFDKYRGLFAEHGDFDIPENYGIGITLRPNTDWTLAIDVNRILFSEVAAMGNAGPGKFGTVPNVVALAGLCPDESQFCLGADGGMGFGWSNQTVYKFGVAFDATPDLTLKAGYNYAKSPINDEMLTFSLLVPAATEHHYSVGMTYKLSENLDVSAMYMRATPNSQEANRLQVIGAGGLAMNQNYYGLGFSWILERPSR